MLISSLEEDFLLIIKPIWNGNGREKVHRSSSFSLSLCSSMLIELDLEEDGKDSARNFFQQKQFSSQVLKEMNEVSSLLTEAMNIHLNVEQDFLVNTSNVFFSLQTLEIVSLLGKDISSLDNARVRFPSSWNLSLPEHSTGSLRVRSFFSSLSFHLFSLKFILEPLPSFGSSSSRMNLSRSISFTWLNREGQSLPLFTTLTQPLEIVIPHDPSFILPPLTRQNVTDHQGFFFHSVNLTPMSSIHLEMRPFNVNLSFVFIYRFDRAPLLNISQPQIDGWTIFSPASNSPLP